jgi:hypothetical protein
VRENKFLPAVDLTTNMLLCHFEGTFSELLYNINVTSDPPKGKLGNINIVHASYFYG